MPATVINHKESSRLKFCVEKNWFENDIEKPVIDSFQSLLVIQKFKGTYTIIHNLWLKYWFYTGSKDGVVLQDPTQSYFTVGTKYTHIKMVQILNIFASYLI